MQDLLNPTSVIISALKSATFAIVQAIQEECHRRKLFNNTSPAYLRHPGICYEISIDHVNGVYMVRELSNAPVSTSNSFIYASRHVAIDCA